MLRKGVQERPQDRDNFVLLKMVKKLLKKEEGQLRGLNNRPEAEILISNAHPRPSCPFIWNIFFCELEWMQAKGEIISFLAVHIFWGPGTGQFGVPVAKSWDHRHGGMPLRDHEQMQAM